MDADFAGKTDSLEGAASDSQVIHERLQFPQIPPVFLARFSQEVGNAVAELFAVDSGASAVSNNPRTLVNLAGTARLVNRLAQLLQGSHLPARQGMALDSMLGLSISKMSPAFNAIGGTIATELHGVKVWMDPVVLELVLDVALEWATRIGSRVGVRISFARGSGHPYLLLTVHDMHDPQWRETMRDEERFENLRWLMIKILAQSQLLDPQRLIVDDSVVVVLRFPAPLVEVAAAGVSTMEIPQQQIKPDAMAGGCHIVVVDPDAGSRMLSSQILHDAGMLVKAFSNPGAAIDSTVDFVAEAIVTGLPPEDTHLITLTGLMRQKNPALKIIRLTDEDCLYIGEQGSSEAARVGRSSMQQVLLTAVNLALEIFAPNPQG